VAVWCYRQKALAPTQQTLSLLLDSFCFAVFID